MKRRTFLELAGVAGLSTLAGCGGGGGAGEAVAPVSGNGRATVTVLWPARTRYIHPDADLFRIVVTDTAGAVLAEQSVPRSGDSPTSTVTFATLPLYDLIFLAEAYNANNREATLSRQVKSARLQPGRDNRIDFDLESQLGLAAAPWAKFRGDNRNTGRGARGTAAGVKRWDFLTGGGTPGVYSSPCVGADGVVYVGSNSPRYHLGSGPGKLYALDAASGNLRWEFTAGGEVGSSPALGHDGTVYVGSADGKLYAVKDGSARWAHQTGGAVRSSPAVGRDGTIYVGSYDGHVYAVNRDGSRRWRTATGGGIYASPALSDDDVVYVGSSDGRFYALSASDGAVRWSVATGNVAATAALADGGTVVVAAKEGPGRVFGLDAATGSARWRFDAPYPMGSSPAVGPDGTVYVGSDGPRCYALDANTGAKRWEFTAGDNVQSSPAVAGDRVYISSADGHLYALGTADGSRIWAFAARGACESSPAVGADGSVYFGSFDGYVYALS